MQMQSSAYVSYCYWYKKIIQEALRSAFAHHEEFDHFNVQNCENARAYKHAACYV